MLTVTTLSDLRAIIANWKHQGERIAFVPTMGNLHAGHCQLVEVAKTKADRVVVSIFVNPTQFSAGEDFDRYPRTESEDQQKLRALGTDLVFLPSVADMYTPDAKTMVTVQGLSDLHCGASRVGHFTGVATVVCKLFNRVQPDIAVFGRKDFQQLAIIETMVRDLDMPIDIIGVDTVRESDGLAMSSRNGYLTPEQRQIAPVLYQTLCQAKADILIRQDFKIIEQTAIAKLQSAGFTVDYFQICRSTDLLPASNDDRYLVLLAAVKLGHTRLIDNISLVIA